MIRRRTWLAAILLVVFAAGTASARSEYSEEGAKACIDCHGNDHVMGIMETAHANAEDPDTPMAQKECQSCHGPSATHMQFPMQVSNLHFGKQSKAEPKVQNQACLECHANGERADWKVSAHGFEDIVCSTCHSIHVPEKIVLKKAEVASGCSVDGCHNTLMGDSTAADFTHAVGQKLGDDGELTCTGCHNPHGPLSSGRCADCHEQSAEILSKQSEKARRFHEVATRKGTECMRCHKGIAHPIPPLALKLQQEAMEQLIAP
jgi:nitrate/TMAO reductase-like tetraheme cytochrome c subunit